MAFFGGDSLEIWNQCVSKLDLQMCSSVIWHVSLTFRQLRKRAWVNGSQTEVQMVFRVLKCK